MRLGAWARGCALSLCCVLAACSSGGEDAGSLKQVEVRVGVKGGRVELDQVALEIPEGALDKELKLSVREQADPSPPAKTKVLSKVYEFGPAGTKFNKEIEVHFKVERDEPGAVVFFTKEQRPDQFEKLATERAERGFVAKVKHFSAGFVGVDEDPETNAGLDGGVDAGDEEPGEGGVEVGDAGMSDGEPGGADAGSADGGAQLPADDAATAQDADATAPDAGAQTRIVLHTFDDVGTPANYTWVAFQDGAGPWQRLSPGASEGHYEFDAPSGRYGVAVVCADGPGANSRGVVRYATTATVDVRVEITATSLCRVGAVPPMHTVSGALTFPAGTYYYRYGHSNLSLLNPSVSATNLIASGVPGGKLADLVAGVGSSQDNGLSRVMIVRDLMLSADLSRPFDFVSQGSDVGPTYSVLVSDASATTNVDVYYTTRGEGGGMPMRQGPTSTPSANNRLLTYASIPAGLSHTDDRYLIVARENDANRGRELILRASSASNQSLALPSHFSSSLDVDTTPYVRPSMSFSDYAGATQYKLSWGFFPASETHSFDMLVDVDYLTTPGAQTLTFPDFSGVQGFDANWVPESDTSETVNMDATAYTYQRNAAIEQKTSATLTGSYRVAP